MIPAFGHKDVEREAKGRQQGVVLILDESLPVRLKMVEILHKLGTADPNIVQSTTADEAIAAFRQHRPMLVFAELVGVHPEDGLDVLHEMLEIEPTARIVLVTSEPRDSPEVRAAIRAGVFAYIEKPLRHEKIRAIIADLEAEEGGIERFR